MAPTPARERVRTGSEPRVDKYVLKMAPIPMAVQRAGGGVPVAEEARRQLARPLQTGYAP